MTRTSTVINSPDSLASKGGSEMSTETLTNMKKAVTLDAALHIIENARRAAEAIGVAMNIAVVDDGNNLVAFQRMDGAWLGSVDIAQGKAYTARAFNMSTKDLAPLCQPGKSLFGIHVSNGGRLIVFPGGIPLERDGEVVGAIGVSGGAVEQDHVVAVAGAEAF
jgi:uncharacterized protein GlcG (DUF336 family)